MTYTPRSIAAALIARPATVADEASALLLSSDWDSVAFRGCLTYNPSSCPSSQPSPGPCGFVGYGNCLRIAEGATPQGPKSAVRRDFAPSPVGT